ncbi:hypothetical protein [Nocardia aurantia]|uniref:Uncharacterized protein n=1 Tax=Nocardia aurantia TaxID=2585199 RepID=A0A7K0DM27_9NOCA|nr:hypothetical protein [Nocardia aurantia]MQY26731.1 hypothetical protein [Nocardia aurantia]
MSIALKVLLQDQRLHEHTAFSAEYKKHAAALDLSGNAAAPPTKGQYYKWLAGTLNTVPRGHHCRILESMFPGWTAEELFSPADVVADRLKRRSRNGFGYGPLVEAVAAALQTRDTTVTGWGPVRLPAATGASTPKLPQAVHDFDAADLPEGARRIGKKLAALSQVLRLDATETVQLASLVGNVMELELRIEIHIDVDGRAHILYTHDIFNMSDEPLTRVARQLWFEHAEPDGLHIEPLRRDHRQISIDRTHNAGATMAKFSCQVSPPIQPGETGMISYTCTGGRFVDAFYWRQDILRYTRRFTIVMRQAGRHRLVTCSGEEVQPNGLIGSATEDLLWDYDGDDIVVTLTRDYLRPNESVTLRWEVDL